MLASFLIFIAFLLGYFCHHWYAYYVSQNKKRTLKYWGVIFIFVFLTLLLMMTADYFYR